MTRYGGTCIRLETLVATGVLAGALAIAGCGGGNKDGDAAKAGAGKRAEASGSTGVLVSVEAIALRTLTNATEVTGEIEAAASVEMAPRVGGRIESMRRADGTLVEEGMAVVKGEALAVIDQRPFAAVEQQAAAGLKMAQAGVEQARIGEAHAARERERIENLFKEGSASAQQRDQTVTAHESAANARKLADAQLAQAEAALNLARVSLDDSTVRAPFAGVVAGRYFDEGAMAAPGVPLFRLQKVDVVHVTGEVSERYLPLLSGGTAEVVAGVDAWPGTLFRGRVTVVSPDVSMMTRTVRLRAAIDNSDNRLKPGMFARTVVILERRENVPVVDEAALVRREGRVYAYVVENRKASRRELKLGLTDGSLHEVLDGLKAGDLVVTTGKTRVADGASVLLADGGAK